MSNVTTTKSANKVGYVAVLCAAVHKNEAPALHADSVRDAASDYAKNAGAKNKLSSIAAACVTTPAGKARTPAAGTLAHSIAAAIKHIADTAAAAGARPDAGSIEEREAAAAVYAASVRELFVSGVDGAAAARKAAAAVKAADKKAAAAAAVNVDAGDDSTAALDADGAPIDAVNVSTLLAELHELRDVAATLAAVRDTLSEVTTERDAAREALAQVTTERDALAHDIVQRDKAHEMAAAAAAAALTAGIAAADMSPTLAQQRKARGKKAAALAA